MVQMGVPVPVIDPMELMLPNVKSAPLVVDSVVQSRFSLPVRVKVRLVEFVGLAVVAARFTVGAVSSIENVFVARTGSRRYRWREPAPRTTRCGRSKA